MGAQLMNSILYLVEYLVQIFTLLKKALIIQNCSFIDIINMDSKWQVGYSGTVNININIEPFKEK